MKEPDFIIPDTCMDIIFDINHTDDQLFSAFNGISDEAFIKSQGYSGKTLSIFAIRFYPWGTYIFSEDSLKNTKNQSVDLDYNFSALKKVIEPMLLEVCDIRQRIVITEAYLLQRFNLDRMNYGLMNGVGEIITHKGNLTITKLAGDLHISSRQLERMFTESIGMSPKKLAALVRYQYLWNDILNKKNFNVLDAVSNYVYTDQAHLAHEFMRYHFLTMKEAKCKALHNVAFIQEDYIR